MSADPAGLAHQAAATLVDAAATARWGEVREGFVHLFRPTPDADAMDKRLDAVAEKVGRASGDERERVRAELADSWRRRLGVFLEDHPEAADQLDALVARNGDSSTKIINANAYDNAQIFIGDTIHVDQDRKRRR